MRVAARFLAFFMTALSCAAGVVSGDDLNANSDAGLSAMQQWYNASGLWTTTGWWNAANCLDAIEFGAIANNGAKYLSVITNTYNLNSSGNFLNNYYDDEGWWAEAWIRAYDITGDGRYLNMAKTIFADMTNGWGSPCGGGIWWNKTHTYKNAIPNELFLLVAIRLHQRMPGDTGATNSYLYWATNEWAWFKATGMINGQNLINDGLTTNCVNNGQTTWTYNQGVIIAGLTDLYKSTGDSSYLNQAVAIANAAIANLAYANGVLREPCETGGCGGGDVPEFKGIFMRHLAYLYDETRNASYFSFLYNNAHSIWFADRNATNQFGLKWTGPVDATDAARQSSALMPISAMAEPSTALLPFAKGSGSTAFNHSLGAAAGTLGWSSAGSSAPGYLQYGPYLASLPNGAHAAHFRISIAATNAASNTNLALLDVRENGVTLASLNVPWNAFVTPNIAQDFSVPFTNQVTGGALEFRVFWNQVSGSPTLTVLDTTINGQNNWTAANLRHDIGRLDGWNSWEADPIRDTSSGYLTKGPGTAELGPGFYSAAFELKVDNFNLDANIIATISVVNTDSNTVVASRNLSRSEFPDTLYHSFTLNFQATANTHYDFRVFWYNIVNAPRLTQRSVVVRPAGGALYGPIALTSNSFNADMVIESGAPSTPASLYTSASMDAGASNTANSWYEIGYNASAPATGLPAAGTVITNLAASDHLYAMPPSYSAPNAAMVDSLHSANMALAASTRLQAVSLLTAAGHGPVLVDYSINHADGTSETGTFSSPDWFSNVPIVYNAQGRVDVATGNFNSVNGNNPRLYAKDILLTNTLSAVTNLHLAWSTNNSGNKVAAVFAVSGIRPYTPPALLDFIFTNNALVLNWTSPAILLEATNVNGPWQTNSTATPPYSMTPTAPSKYYRLQVN